MWVYLQYRRRAQDIRSDEEILAEGRQQLTEIRQRGVFIASGYGATPSQLKPELQHEIRNIYDDAKLSIWAELDRDFLAARPTALVLKSESASREDYILHPSSGEQFGPPAIQQLTQLKAQYGGKYQVQLVISDGLNALAINDLRQLNPFISRLNELLQQQNLQVAPVPIVVQSGRVRAGYKIGQTLFSQLSGTRGLIHLIGERPGSGHRTFSAYMTCASASKWESGQVDHDITQVVAGIANTALAPIRAADDAARIFGRMWQG